ncbi:MAG TPA: ROK family transcriptional regulator [Galbitalea sp.]|jgi:predicted NBD/HSP70 family sugar kinase/biotin operon repressor
MSVKASVLDVSRANRALALRHVLMSEQVSRGSIAGATGLSPATVTKLVNELIEEGVLVEAGHEDSEGGRRRTILAVDPRAAIQFGADVSENRVMVDAFDLSMTRIGRKELAIENRSVAPTAVADFIETSVAELIEAAGISRERVLGLGLGVPGIVEHPAAEGSASVIHAKVLDWDEVRFAGLADRLGFPVLIDNGAKTTTQAESWYGSAKGADHAILVLIGDSAGAGIITDGQLYRGSSSSAGEWGHTKISTDGPRCTCGSWGCVDTFVGASSVLERWDDGQENWFGREVQGVDALLDAWSAVDESAVETLHDVVKHLGLALSNLINLFNPQKIIIGGWFGERIADLFLEELAVATRRFSLKQPGDEATLERSALGQDAATLGAATLPLDRFIESGWPHTNA